MEGHEKINLESNLSTFFRDRLPRWGFSEFEAALKEMTKNFSPLQAVEELSKIHDHLAGWDTGEKDRGALMHLVRDHLDSLLNRVNGGDGMFP